MKHFHLLLLSALLCGYTGCSDTTDSQNETENVASDTTPALQGEDGSRGLPADAESEMDAGDASSNKPDTESQPSDGEILSDGKQDTETPLSDTSILPDTLSDTEGTEDSENDSDTETFLDTTVPEDTDLPIGEDAGGGTGTECLTDYDYFVEVLWEPLLQVQCVGCHVDGGTAKDSAMVFETGGTQESLEANFNTFVLMAEKTLGNESILLLKPTGLHPEGHTGGSLINPESSAYNELEEFVARITTDFDPCEEALSNTCEEVLPGKPLLRRLSRFEYDQTIEALFGIPSTWGSTFTPETVVHDFDNNADAVVVNGLFADQIRNAAEEIAPLALGSPGLLTSCAGLDEGDCADVFIPEIGKRIFRRPLGEDDVVRYRNVYLLVAAEDGHNTGLQWVLTAMLQSPHFLYREEWGTYNDAGVYVLNGYEIASSLSYLFWGSMPDNILFEKAENGDLLTSEGRMEEASRLLNDPKAEKQVLHFSRQWLQVEQLETLTKAAEIYPAFTEQIREHMMQELDAFISATLLKEFGNVEDLFTSNQGQMHPDLAAFYGIGAETAVGVGDNGMTLYELEDTPYGGILSKGALLTRHAFPDASSPIHRGMVVRERFLCNELPPPPPGLNVEAPPVDPNATTKDRFLAHSSVEPCTSCHQLIDPIGFGFEAFDGIGRHRTEENGLPIDDTGEIVGGTDIAGSFTGIDELALGLAGSEDMHACYSLQWFRYGYGQEEKGNLSCLIQSIDAAYAESEHDFSSLLTALAGSPHLSYRIGEEPLAPMYDPETLETVPIDPEENPEEPPSSVPTPEELGIDVEITVDSEWNSGYCWTVGITNLNAEPVQWIVELELDGDLTQAWNADSIEMDGSWVFTGVNWNAVLPAQGTASFGFCAAL